MKNYFGINFDKQKEAILNCSAIKHFVAEIISKADSAAGKTYPALKMSEYMLFYETGDRSTYEKKYFERRSDCAYLSAALWLTEDKKYVSPLINAIFTICDEYTWCSPAHVHMEKNPSPEKIVGFVDLFNGETARLLTETVAVNSEKLPSYVNERISYEIRRRVIEGLKNSSFWWEKATNNWAAVCAGCSAAALLHFGTEEEINTLMPRLYNAIDGFLSGFENDGCCTEDFMYWNYGFGHFLYFAKLLYTFTDGKKNYFDLPKVKNIGMFPQKIRMGKTKVYCVSDCDPGYEISLGSICLLRSIYGKDILYPTPNLPIKKLNVFSLKELLWFDANYKADDLKAETVIFENSEWYVKRGKLFSFGAKGGNNDEPHNHNDIGSLMIVKNDGSVPIADLGRGEYRNGTFDPSIRYTLFVNGSQGHSVPIINGKNQLAGSTYKAANVCAGENFFSLDIEGAYEKGAIEKLNRHFEITNSSVILTDTFKLTSETDSICERFISLIEPQICDGFVSLGDTKICFEKGKYEVTLSSETYDTRMNADGLKTAYIIDFKLLKQENKTVFEIII